MSDIINTLLSLDRYFIRDPHFKMYNIYGGIKNLLFKVNYFKVEEKDESLIFPSPGLDDGTSIS